MDVVEMRMREHARALEAKGLDVAMPVERDESAVEYEAYMRELRARMEEEDPGSVPARVLRDDAVRVEDERIVAECAGKPWQKRSARERAAFHRIGSGLSCSEASAKARAEMAQWNKAREGVHPSGGGLGLFLIVILPCVLLATSWVLSLAFA